MTANALTSKSSTSGRAGDKIFSGAALGAGVLILITLFAVAVFLLIQALPTFMADPADISGGVGFLSYIWPIVVGTVIAAAIALLIATPVGLGVALFISHFAPRRIAGPLGYVIDLLAAIPSVIYGAWGYMVLAPALVPGYEWLAKNLGFIPIFEGPASQRSEEHTSELQSRENLVCRLLLEKKNNHTRHGAAQLPEHTRLPYRTADSPRL